MKHLEPCVSQTFLRISSECSRTQTHASRILANVLHNPVVMRGSDWSGPIVPATGRQLSPILYEVPKRGTTVEGWGKNWCRVARRTCLLSKIGWVLSKTATFSTQACIHNFVDIPNSTRGEITDEWSVGSHYYPSPTQLQLTGVESIL